MQYISKSFALIGISVGMAIAAPVHAQDKHKLLLQGELKAFSPGNARTLSEGYLRFYNERLAKRTANDDLTKFIKPLLLRDKISDVQLAQMTYFSWRDKKMVTPAKSQGPYGTCWAFAVTAAIESNYLIRRGELFTRGSVPDFSEQDLINCGCRNQTVCTPAQGPDLLSSGLTTYYDNLIKTGLSSELDNPYTGDGSCSVCDTCNQIKVKSYGIEATGWVEPVNGVASVADTKRALLKYGPVAIGIQLPAGSTFGAHKGKGVFRETLTNYTGYGGHIILVVGWDDTNQAWLIKNSWGTDWGDQGFGWLGYGSNKEQISGRQYVIARMPPQLITQRPSR